ncbi:MAG: biotin synthase BioB [Candidatus Omnitrophica bacterium]|nr:biotin synthase BioB [Candidatus Omnitrophota bacterium]
MKENFYTQLTTQSLAGKPLSPATCQKILSSKETELLPLLNATFEVRRKSFGKKVKIHIINNVQNGYCRENCKYCAQSASSHAPIQEYAMKSDEEIMEEAKNAYEKGAARYCMVFSGKGPTWERIKHVAELVKEIKTKFPMEVCVSPGIIDDDMALLLKKAGLNRINHNLNTSRRHYKKICTSHTYDDRLETLAAAKKAQLQICSGVIIGMGEEASDIIEMASTLQSLKIASIPVNFFMPIEGLALKSKPKLTPEDCLRILCLFRLCNPLAEIRVAAGRELYLRHLEPLAFYPANSLFMDGYLNVKGRPRLETLQMIKDAGFTIESDFALDDLITKEKNFLKNRLPNQTIKMFLKTIRDLRPTKESSGE